MLTLTTISLALGALLYGAMALWRSWIGGFRGKAMPLSISFFGMALWALTTGTMGGAYAVIAEVARNLCWITYLWFIMRREKALLLQRWIARLPVLLAVTQAAAGGASILSYVTGNSTAGLVSLGLSLMFFVGALTLLHSLHFAAHRLASGFRLTLGALAVLWAYDFNLYAAVFLRLHVPTALIDGRAIVALLLAPIFAVAARRKENWTIGLSRTVTIQSLSLVGIGAYLVLIAAIGSTHEWISQLAEPLGMITAVMIGTAVPAVLLLSSRSRSRTKVFLTKHLFKHRYDYRTEWLRFNATINSGGLVGLSPEQRAIKSLADLVDAAGGLFFSVSGRNELVCAAVLDWPVRTLYDEVRMPSDLLNLVEHDSHILISPFYDRDQEAGAFPVGLPTDGSIWFAVPLVRMGALVGIIALGRPQLSRDLDWEDFDLLKVVGQQIATYIADAQRQSELEQSRQFEEFNRRFAFIVHDIKNVVSQLALVAENAAEHGSKPRFQADMVATLRNAVAKMNTLLARLTIQHESTEMALEEIDASALMEEIARARECQHPLSFSAGAPITIVADHAKLNTAIDHLIQNAIEASEPEAQIVLSIDTHDGEAFISVSDAGKGMTAEFIRTQLFKPFASTKPGGFGIGASEARTLVRDMGGELEARSVEGVGTNFIIKLPLVHTMGKLDRS